MPRPRRVVGERLSRLELSLEVLDFLLAARRSAASIDRLHARGIRYDPFATFHLDQMPTAQFLGLWRQYEPILRAEAQRRDVELLNPNDYRPMPLGIWPSTTWEGD